MRRSSSYRWLKWAKRILIPLGAGLLLILCAPLPDPLFKSPHASTLYSREGVLLDARIAADEQWRFAPGDSLPYRFVTALTLFEDEYFHYHPGINPVSLARAAWQNYQSGKIKSGGSTLTMQTVRLAFGNSPRTYAQKLKEVWCALKLELTWSKREILETYAAHAPFGGNIVGVEAASYRYYGRPPEQLSWSESALLAILPNDPSSIFPGRNQEQLRAKRNRLLEKIHKRGFLSDDEYFLAREEVLPDKVQPLPDAAPHLLQRALAENRSKNGRILSSLDHQLQSRVIRLASQHSNQLAENQIHNAAVLVLDIESGQALAYVGNTDNMGEHGQQVDVITARRSPGSLLKPFLYAMAMDEGIITPYELLPDLPLFYKGFAPKNFDRQFRGAVPANQALISSLNVPFVHLLIDYGYEKFHHNLKAIGFNSLDQPASHYGLSIILGGAETTLWEITGAYAGMARAMYRFDERKYQSGYSRNDYHENQYTTTFIPEDRLSESGLIRIPSIRYTLEAMQDLNRPDEESGWEQFSSASRISWKTGTSYGFRDGWAIGLNDSYVVGVWVGNADGEGRPGLTGNNAAAPLMFRVFDLLQGENELVQPFGKETELCLESGMIASRICPNTYIAMLPDYLQETATCHYHRLVSLDRNGEYRVNSSCYPVSAIQQQPWFILPPAQAWYFKKFHPAFEFIPPALERCNTNVGAQSLTMIYPQHRNRIQIPKDQSGHAGKVIFEAAHEDPSALVFWHLDDAYIGSTEGNHQMGMQPAAGEHMLTLVDHGGRELTVLFEVSD